MMIEAAVDHLAPTTGQVADSGRSN